MAASKKRLGFLLSEVRKIRNINCFCALLGLIAMAGGSAISRASRSANIYNPSVQPIRAFGEDYKAGALVDEAGRLLDIEGKNPLTARYVVGRAQAGGNDVALPREALDEVTKALVGAPAAVVPQSALGRNLGRVSVNPYSGRPLKVAVSGDVGPEKFPLVYSHEVGHVIDQIAGEIPTDRFAKQFRRIYNDLNTSPDDWRMARQERTGEPIKPKYQMTPDAFGYAGRDVPREYVAEAIRAYMADPNYIKEVAPDVAKLIRQHVNSNPLLNKTIQFNTRGCIKFQRKSRRGPPDRRPADRSCLRCSALFQLRDLDPISASTASASSEKSSISRSAPRSRAGTGV